MNITPKQTQLLKEARAAFDEAALNLAEFENEAEATRRELTAKSNLAYAKFVSIVAVIENLEE